MSGTTAACIFIGLLVLIIAVLAYFLFRKKTVTTIVAPTTPKMDAALQVELKAMADRATIQVKTEQATAQLDAVKALPDNMEKLAKLAALVRASKNL